MHHLLHRFALHARLRSALRGWATSGGRWRHRVLYGLLSPAFDREFAAVAHGLSNHKAQISAGFNEYQLRRHIHMIEKGLTMRPRRQSFAVEYIESTIVHFSVLVRNTETVELSEFDWMASVLDQYFIATKDSTNAAIVSARQRYYSCTAAGDFNPAGPHEYGQTNGVSSFAELAELAHRRRSVRWFLPKKVDREVLDRAVQVAMEAPTACNRQPYEFVLFEDAGQASSAASIAMGTRGYADQIPGLAVVTGDLSAFFDERDRHLIYVDGCLAAMSFVLALEAQGVSTCCINWPDIPEREEAMSSLLGLSRHERVVMLIAFGYGDPSGLVPRSIKRDLSVARRYMTP